MKTKVGSRDLACRGWVSYDGAGLLERFYGRFTAEVFEHILENVMIPSAGERYPEGTLFFQQGNHPVHTANRIQRWFTGRPDVDLESTRIGFIIDLTVRFEMNEEQPADVDKEKKNIYNPTIPYYLQKYQLEELEVIGLLVGARGTATLFMKDVFKRLGIPTSITIVTLAALKGSITLLKHHLYSK
ncbi:hypothetical protein ANN_04671 [Periplaneta americana]|uniref:Per a allergen n=1 Tax=Periplaneta americana TaxID=6978 RepID=A0ABQ8T923_PERAM|nr:hypothetical protein ANN_04671 [Periplaneta americana]